MIDYNRSAEAAKVRTTGEPFPDPRPDGVSGWTSPILVCVYDDGRVLIPRDTEDRGA